jgi:hypothetical protein
MERFERADGAQTTAALLLPAAMLCARWSVGCVLAGAVLALLFIYSIGRLAARAPDGFAWPRWFLWTRRVWCAMLLGGVLALTRDLFPQAGGSWLIPAVLAALAATACARGTDSARRVAAAVWPLLLAAWAVVALFAAPDVKWNRLAESGDGRQVAAAFAVCLLPGLRVRQGTRWDGALGGALCLSAAGICVGLLGAPQVAALDFPFYTAAQSISVFGVMERFEGLLSAALAVSAFCALGLIVDSAAPQTPRGAWALIAVGAAGMLAVPCVSGWVWVIGNCLFCGLFPAGILAVAASKNCKKLGRKS